MYQGDPAGLAHWVTAKTMVPVFYEPVLAVQSLCVTYAHCLRGTCVAQP